MSTERERLGPLVHRSVRHGAILWVVGAVQFVLAMAVTQLGWSGPAYSLRLNYISDLGATNCADWMGRWVCSPWHVVFDASAVLLGVLVILGAILLRTAFPPRTTRTVGLLLLTLAGIGAIGVGLFPENLHLPIHQLVALLAFLAGNLTLIVLGVAMFRDTRWDGYRAFSMILGLIGLVALGLFVGHAWGALGPGGLERLVVAPVLLWLLVTGIHLIRIPTFAPSSIPHPGSA
jgi:hypothetical membrane protein